MGGQAERALVECWGRGDLMPLRDHFRPPVEEQHSWDELHGMWPAVIVQHLFPILPEGYVAAPRVHLGSAFEIDVSAYERVGTGREDPPSAWKRWRGCCDVGAPESTLTLETDLPDQDEYEVRVYDVRHGRRLVAAIEIVSPANKDRPESRRAFVAKVAALLQRDVSVSIVDVVTIRQFVCRAARGDRRTRPAAGAEPPPLLRGHHRRREGSTEAPFSGFWFHPMVGRQTLPLLPIWLNADFGVFLELESSYEEACRVLRIT